MLSQPRVSGDATRSTSSCPDPSRTNAQASANGRESQPITPSTPPTRSIRSGQARTHDTHDSRSRAHKPVPSTWASRGAFRTHQEGSGYACHLVPRLERGGRRTTASHQSRHRTLPRPPASSPRNPSNHTPSPPPGHNRLRSATGIRTVGRTQHADCSSRLPERSAQV